MQQFKDTYVYYLSSQILCAYLLVMTLLADNATQAIKSVSKLSEIHGSTVMDMICFF